MSLAKPQHKLPAVAHSQLRKIMVTTDFSSHSEKTFASVARLAKQFNAKVHLVHFGSKRAPAYSGITDIQHLKNLRLALTRESKRDELGELDVKTCVLERRDVAHSLRSYQQEHECDLIVTHTLAHQGFERHFDHRLAEKIVACSTVPVLLFGPAAILAGIDKPKTVLVPFDFSDKALAVFPVLQLLAANYQCSFKLLFVQTLCSQWFQRLMGANQYQIGTFEKRFEELIEVELSKLDVELEVCPGIPEYEFGNRACNSEADLIVIGTYGKLGNLTKSIIRQARCPVLAVPTEREKESFS